MANELRNPKNTATSATISQVINLPPTQNDWSKSSSIISRQNPTNLCHNLQISTVEPAPLIIQQQQTQQHSVQPQSSQIIRTPAGTTIQRKTILMPTNNTISQGTSTPSTSRTVVSKAPAFTAPNTMKTTTIQQKAVTPEQKILQLSKSGDLKVTKKVIREDMINNQRQTTKPQQIMTTQPQHQKLRQQQQSTPLTPQIQIQIQRIEQPVTNTTTSTAYSTIADSNRTATVGTGSTTISNDNNLMEAVSKANVDSKDTLVSLPLKIKGEIKEQLLLCHVAGN